MSRQYAPDAASKVMIKVTTNPPFSQRFAREGEPVVDAEETARDAIGSLDDAIGSFDDSIAESISEAGRCNMLLNGFGGED